MCKDNKGYSMIELLVIIALMGIIGAGLVYSFSLVTGQYARECASNLSATLDKARNYSFTKSASSDAYVEISLEAEGYVATYYVPQSPIDSDAEPGTADYKEFEKDSIGKKDVEIICNLADGSSFKISGAESLRIYYDRINGAFKEAARVSGATATKAFCKSITVKRGKIYELAFYNATGKHTLERTD